MILFTIRRNQRHLLETQYEMANTSSKRHAFRFRNHHVHCKPL